MGCVGAPGHACFLVLARPLIAKVERLRSVLERIANGSFTDADAAAEFAGDAVEIATEALEASLR